ncbi:MAG: hypothetical protein M3N21_06020 [Actinomycetota bacterium]|nr:hypothetical protein [Actinomycetota bacterium]
MRLRPAVSVATLLVLTLGAAAGNAGTPPSCNLMQAPAGDASDQVNGVHLGPNEPELDIVSGDVASDARSVTTVIRVLRLGSATEALERQGIYRFFFRLGAAPGTAVTIATRGLDGERFQVLLPSEGQSTVDTSLPATGTFDIPRNEVRVTVPIEVLTGGRHGSRRTFLSQLAADTYRGVGTGRAAASTSMDQASTTRRYLAGSPSCVSVGH